jgi:hypothetical protein
MTAAPSEHRNCRDFAPLIQPGDDQGAVAFDVDAWLRARRGPVNYKQWLTAPADCRNQVRRNELAEAA